MYVGSTYGLMAMRTQSPFLGHHIYALRYMMQDVALLFGTEHQVHAFQRSHLLWFQLSITSRHDDQSTRMVTHHPADGLTTFGIGHLCHATCIDNAYISRLAI